MGLQIRKVQAWSAEVDDRPGAAAAILERLARAGADLEFAFTRPHPRRPDTSVIFLAPIVGAEQTQAARGAGLGPAVDVTILCVEGDNHPGMAFQLMSCLAVAGVNLRGMSVSAVGKRFAGYLAFDSLDEANLAIQVLAELEE